MTLYIAVTNDKYELPLTVEDSMSDLAEWADMSYKAVSVSLSKDRPGKKKGFKLLRVEIDF